MRYFNTLKTELALQAQQEIIMDMQSDPSRTEIKKIQDNEKSEQQNISTKNDKVSFKPYIDKESGKAIEDFSAMRNGATNAMFFATNKDKYKEVTEIIDGALVPVTPSQYQYFEPMHGVNIKIAGKDLYSIKPSIVRGLCWIQLAFTARLGCNHPPDSIIEEARQMYFDIDGYMHMCGLADRESSIQQIKEILYALTAAQLEWTEEVNVYDKFGKPVYEGKYKDKDGNLHRRQKREIRTYKGSGIIGMFDTKPKNGKFKFWISRDIANYLAHSGVIGVTQKLFQLDFHKHANAFALSMKLMEYYFINRKKNKKQAQVLSINSLLNAIPGLAQYEDLKENRLIESSDGTKKEYGKNGGAGGFASRIMNPFETLMNVLVELRVLTKWYYTDNTPIKSYEDFLDKYIHFELNLYDEY